MISIKSVYLVVGSALQFMQGDPQPELFAIGCNRDRGETLSTADSPKFLYLDSSSLVPDRVRQLLPKFHMDKEATRLPGEPALKPPAAERKKISGDAQLILSREQGCGREQVIASNLG